jgi:membrane fusion protein, multidrug efflux system
MRRASLQLSTALLIALSLPACDDSSKARQQAQQTLAPVPVGVVTVKPTAVTLGEAFVGRVNAIQKVDVRSRVTGFIEARLFEEGTVVQQGAPLFRIERGTYEAITEQRRADLASAEAQVQNAEVQLRRAHELAQRDNIARATVDEREAAARQARAAVLQAQAALKQAEINLGYTEIGAPIGGRTGRAAFDVGALVGPDTAPLVQIVSVDPTYVIFPVSQRRMVQVQQEAGGRGLRPEDFVVHVRFTPEATYPHPGKIDFVGNTVQRGTDTVEVRAVVPNPDGLLRDGQFVQVLVEQAQPQMALTVPQAAVQTDRQGRFVLVVNPDNKIDVRRIETGETLNLGNIAVRSGLNEGDRVVVQGLQQVRPGSPVTPRPAESMSGGQ